MLKLVIYGNNTMKNSLLAGVFLLVLLLLGSSASAKERLVIAGTGDSQAILQQLAVLFKMDNPGIVVDVPHSIGSSGGGVKAIKQHTVDLARTARPLKEKEKSVELAEILFARSPVVFVAAPGTTVNNVSTRQVLDIFSGKIKNWKELGGPDHKIYPVDREPGDSSRNILEKYLLGFKEIQGVGKIFYSTPETAEAVYKHPFTFGFVPLSIALEYQLHILSLDGHAATQGNVLSGKYLLLTPFYLIQSKQSGPRAQRFIDFVFTPDARKLMVENGVYPVDAP